MTVRSDLTPIVRVVDDDARVRESVAFILRLAGWQTEEYANALEFLERNDPQRPGCLVLDIRMPEMSGLELQSELKRRNLTLPILFLTGHGDVETAVMALKRGAADFLSKPMDPEKLPKAVGKLVAWHVSLSKQIEEKERILRLFSQLTDKEKEVCRHVAGGLSNKEIAAALGSSEPTVKSHRARICSKLNLKSAVEIAAMLRTIDSPVETTYPIGTTEPT